MKKLMVVLLSAVLALGILAGCGGESKPTGVPEDFSFAIAWNPYGDSTYDSATGVLIKQLVADPVADYTTELKLSGAQLKEIWEILSALDLDGYPDMLQPQNPSNPGPWLNLTVRQGEKERSVYCLDLDAYRSSGEAGRTYAEAGEKIVEILTATKEWQALPDYQELYW